MGRSRGRRWILGLVLALGACADDGGGLDATALCDHVCGCQSPFPSIKDPCVARCESDLGGAAIDEACGGCIVSLSCSEIGLGFDSCSLECGGDQELETALASYASP